MMKAMEFPSPEQLKKYPSKCSVCGGTVAERTIDIPLPDSEGTIRLIEEVPAGVCDECGEYYLTVETSRAIDRLLDAPPSREDKISVWKYAAGL